MSLQPETAFSVPETTRQIAQAAFPKGNLYMKMRDELGVLFADPQFSDLFPPQGQPAEAPWRLATVTLFQFVEGLTDRQAADAVRARLDWKYALGLELGDPGFDASVLCEFRTRLLTKEVEARLFDLLMQHFQKHQLFKARGTQRTDSTHILARVRGLSRLECLGETLRYALNSLASLAPEWLVGQVPSDWWDRYGCRIDNYRLPKGQSERDALALQVGTDGVRLLQSLADPHVPASLRAVQAVQILRRVWIQNFLVEEGKWRLRTEEEAPPCRLRIKSPYDVDACYSTKRQTHWTGYKVHLSETCNPDTPLLITHVLTTKSTTDDSRVLDTIHAGMSRDNRLPAEHIVDEGYLQADALVKSLHDYGVHLLGPLPKDCSRQANAQNGFDVPHFTLDWDNQRALCPGGQLSSPFQPMRNSLGKPRLMAVFATEGCRACAHGKDCTQSKKTGRILYLHPQAEQEAMQAARRFEQTTEFRARYAVRAGIEGCLSQGVREFGLRHCRYIGEAKAHLQNLMTAAAMNFCRAYAWLTDCPRAQTRQSHFARLKPALGGA
jgi:transposase